MTDSSRYGVDLDTKLEDAPSAALHDMVLRACETLVNTRACFDAVHAIAVLALQALENGEVEKAKRLLAAVQEHPAAGRIPEQHGAPIVH